MYNRLFYIFVISIALEQGVNTFVVENPSVTTNVSNVVFNNVSNVVEDVPTAIVIDVEEIKLIKSVEETSTNVNDQTTFHIEQTSTSFNEIENTVQTSIDTDKENEDVKPTTEVNQNDEEGSASDSDEKNDQKKQSQQHKNDDDDEHETEE